MFWQVLTLNGKKSRLQKRDFVAAAQKMGIDEKAIDKMIISFNRIMPKWNLWINSSFLSDELKQKYMDLITQRMKHLMGEWFPIHFGLEKNRALMLVAWAL